MSNRYVPDSVFLLSVPAWWRTVARGKRTGVSAERILRDRAERLSLAAKPSFNLPGGELVREVRVGIPGEVLDRLEAMCKRLSVPRGAVGELIACWTEERA